MSYDEAILIEQSKQGDIQAFETLVKHYESRIYNFFVKMCNDAAIAQDMMQETFINVFMHLSEFKGKSAFSTWLFQIAVNHCLMHKRKNKADLNQLDDDDQLQNSLSNIETVQAWEFDPALIYEKKELKQILDQTLQELPEIYRAVFILKDIEGFKAQEISDILSISVTNAKTRILRARLMLKNLLKETLFPL